MASLKDLFLEIEDGFNESDDNAIEVYADSVKHALELASKELDIEVTLLDYEILEKGTKGIFGIGRQPYRIIIRPHISQDEHEDLDLLEKKLAGDHIPGIKIQEKQDVDSEFKVRVTKSGIWLTVEPPKGKGKKLDVNEINNKLYSMRITKFDQKAVEKEANKSSGKKKKIGDWVAYPEFDGTMNLEVSDDEMKAFIHFVPPRYCGRHMEYDEVVGTLKKAGIVIGLKEEDIKTYLEEMDYNGPLLAAEGDKPKHGNDAQIEYKVRVGDDVVHFEEDESGKVDFRNLELLENVVVGQLLAVKVPAEEGIPGRTLFNKVLPAKSGKDMKISHGKGTILSEDGKELTAEINGQVVFKANKISVEPVYVVNGDVSLETGNIVFLGSVIVAGSVQDNFVVKAAGNIEVKGTVQKASLEAEGDIIIHQGIMGREEAKIESTGGTVFAKFVQSATVVAENDVFVPEGIMHSHVDAGKRIYSNGRRARIVGGVIRAGDEVNARFLGADVSTKTDITVGINPKVLQQIYDLKSAKESIEEELTQIRLNKRTLETQKRNAGTLSGEKEKMLEDITSQESKLSERLDEINLELEELDSYVNMLEHKGKICAEKTAFPGVNVYIKDKDFKLKDPYNSVTFTMEGGEIQIKEYEPPEIAQGAQRLKTISGRRRF